MTKTRCDILVVGAGPAGSAAAARAAGMGPEVVVAERRPAVGRPVRCAEYIPAQLLGETGGEKGFVVQAVSGMKTHLPDGTTVTTAAPGFTVNRDGFDRVMARRALDAGADIRLSCRVMDCRHGIVTIRDRKGRVSEIFPQVIIGADGPLSRVGRWMGAVNRRLIPGIQARVRLIEPLDYTEVYFHMDFLGGYAWLFPKGDRANVGLGCRVTGKSLVMLLTSFLQRLASEKKIHPDILHTFGGWIPAEAVRSAVTGNMMLAGDAAGQTHPLTGGGIAPAVVCGKMAGKWAARAVQGRNIHMLKKYDVEWQEMFGPTNRRAYQRRTAMEESWEDMEEIITRSWVAFREYYEGM